MRSTLTAIVVAAGLFGFGVAAQAAPVATVNPLGVETTQIELVRGGRHGMKRHGMRRHHMKRHRMMRRHHMRRHRM